MATGAAQPAGGFFARRAVRRQADDATAFALKRPLRVLTASARVIDPEDKDEARRLRSVRQGWQAEAWGYRDSIGEIRYAGRFMAHCVGRMRVFPAAYPSTDFGEDPISLVDIEGVPPSVVASANAAMNELGSGRLSMSQILESTAENFFVAGECNMVSKQDPATGQDRFRIASVDEVIVKDDKWWLRELPAMGQTSDQSSWYELTEDDYLARLWCPHPRFAALADSALRALGEQCDELLILSRMIRSAGRSRLAGAGMLLIPDEMSLASTTEDNEDAEADDFMGALTDAMMEPIGDEAAASAVVPIVVQGPADMLKAVTHVTFDRAVDPIMAAQRQELISRIAIGLDLPSEVLTGKADLNHWTAWNVDDNTFRHHVEPAVIAVVDALTVGYLRTAMLADGCDPAWVNRVVLWYDATDLVVHPDRSGDALQLHERLVISDNALREACGYTDQDAPTVDEIWMRSLRTTRTWPPNIIESMLHAYAPELKIYPDKNEPGINPDGTSVSVAVPAAPALPAGPGTTSQAPPALPSNAGPGTPNAGPPVQASALELMDAVGRILTAAGRPVPAIELEDVELIAAGARTPSPEAVRLSRRLVDIDRDLRTRLQVLANAAVRQVLSRSGARLRTKVAASKDETMKAKIDHRPNEHVAGIIGESAVAALGLTAAGLVGTDWSDIEPQFNAWVKGAQTAAVQTACKLGRIDPAGPKAAAALAALEQSRTAAWRAFTAALDAITADLLYRPTIRASAEEPWGDLDPNGLVPAGLVRDTLAIAGGTDPGTTMQGMDDRSSTEDGPLGQIGTGDAVSGLLTDAGAEVMSYEWVHGPAVHPFDPHAELDGLTFSSFDDDSLANADDFPDAAYYTPGDHVGCTCDFMPTWDIPGVDAANGDEAPVEGMVDYAGERTPTGPAEGRGGEDFIPGVGIFGYGDEATAARAALPDLTAEVMGATANVDASSFATVGTDLDSFATRFGDLPAATSDTVQAYADGMAIPTNELLRAAGDVDPAAMLADPSLIPDAPGLVGLDRVELRDAIEAVPELDGVMVPTPESVLVQRVMTEGDPLGLANLTDDELRNVAGTVVTDPGYMSTSLLPLPADSSLFAGPGAGLEPGTTVLTIGVPAGTDSVPVFAVNSSFADEQELLLGRGQNLAITSAERDADGIIRLEATIIRGDAMAPGDVSLAAETVDAAAATSAASVTPEAMAAEVETLTSDVTVADVKAAQADIMPDVRAAADASRGNLENLGVQGIQRPARGDTSGEYDWLRSLSTDERGRLRNNGWLDASEFASTPDQVVAGYEAATGAVNATTDEAMAYWLTQTRTIDAANLLESTGRLPANLTRFGNFDWKGLSAAGRLDVSQLFAVQRDAVEYLSSAEKEAAYHFAERELKAHYGPSIYEMKYDDWLAEVQRLGRVVENAVPVSEDAEFGATFSAADTAALARLDELTPFTLCNAEGGYVPHELYLEAQTIAVNAGLVR